MFAQTGGDILYNVKKVQIQELDPVTMDVKAEADVIEIVCDSEIGLEPVLNEGSKAVLRDATKILALAQEDDLLESMNLKLTTVKLPVIALPIIQGGKVRMGTADTADEIVGYDAPTMEEGSTQKKYFKLTIYVPNYQGEEIVNYVKFTFPKCRGTLINLNFRKEFFAPEFDIKATDNTKLKKPVYSFDYVASI